MTDHRVRDLIPKPWPATVAEAERALKDKMLVQPAGIELERNKVRLAVLRVSKLATCYNEELK